MSWEWPEEQQSWPSVNWLSLIISDHNAGQMYLRGCVLLVCSASWSLNQLILPLPLHSLSVTPIGRIRGIPAFDSVRCTRFVSARCILDIFSQLCRIPIIVVAVSTLFSFSFIFFFIGPRRILPHLNLFLLLHWLSATSLAAFPLRAGADFYVYCLKS